MQGADAPGEGHTQAGAGQGRGNRQNRIVVASQRLSDPLPRDWRLGMRHTLAHVRALPSPFGGIPTGLERQLCYRLLRSREPHGRDRCAVRHCRRIGQKRDQVDFGDVDCLGQRHLERLLPVAAVGRPNHRPHLQAVVMPIDDQLVALRRPPGDQFASQHERLGQHRRQHAPADEGRAEAVKVAMGGVEQQGLRHLKAEMAVGRVRSAAAEGKQIDTQQEQKEPPGDTARRRNWAILYECQPIPTLQALSTSRASGPLRGHRAG